MRSHNPRSILLRALLVLAIVTALFSTAVPRASAQPPAELSRVSSNAVVEVCTASETDADSSTFRTPVERAASKKSVKIRVVCSETCTIEQAPCVFIGTTRSQAKEAKVENRPGGCPQGAVPFAVLTTNAAGANTLDVFCAHGGCIDEECPAPVPPCEASGTFYCNEVGDRQRLDDVVQVIACFECPPLQCPPLCIATVDSLSPTDSDGADMEVSIVPDDETEKVGPAACLFTDSCAWESRVSTIRARPVRIIETNPNQFNGLDPCLFTDTCNYTEQARDLAVIELSVADFDNLLILAAAPETPAP